ncbi:glycosyl transferase [Roseovarius sp. A46]|uniref:transglycosylase domain-containing protein n=1 Tax=Roseovarius sp. A46 TaxID=2109331 RepID=UPI001010C06B|nr:PBP1A family penicillin-binding protein [Roseovarius sp. A46]RXV66779.1 glycosyl transferase [Roseovarius sp. A46]
MGNSGRRKPPLAAPKRSRAGGGRARKSTRRAPRRRSRNPLVRLMRTVLRLLWRLVWGIGWRMGVVVLLVTGLAVAYTYTTLPAYQTLMDGRARGSVTLLDRDGEVFAWRGDQFGGVVTVDTVSPHLRDAVIATEDRRFHYHPGVDPIGIASAIRINLSEGRGPLSGNGGSTITQQTAKLLCFGETYDETRWKSEAEYVSYCRRTSIWRKVREAVYALAMEAKYTKDQILTIYLNRAYLGAGAYGAEAAAQRYFGKSAAELNPSEAAMIAGLLTAPSALAPTANLERSQDRASVVIGLMREQGYLSADQAEAALARPAQLSEAAEQQAGGYFADWVMGSGPEFLTRDTTEDVIIRTTLDQRIQRAAETAMKSTFTDKVREESKAQAAIVVMSADGAVRAMVGGRDTTVIGAFNRATMAKRQTGSAFKPFVYATALELGFDPNTVVMDEPYCLDIPGSGRWCPENYSRDYKGRVTLTQALAQSINVPAVKIARRAGLDKVRRVAGDFGIESDLADGPALALGVSESTLLEMTGAYAGILNGGSSVTPYGLTELRLMGEQTPLMSRETGIGERVIRESAARKLVYMMSRVVEAGTGQRARLPRREVAGKTGTTQAARDAWFLGFTADYVAGVWMGYDDNTPLTGVTGGGLPAEIWRETMTRVHEGLPPKPLPMQRPAPRSSSSEPLPQQRAPVVRGNPIETILRSLFGN